MKILAKLKKAYSFFKRARSQGASIFIALLIVCCRIAVFILDKYNIYINDEVKDNILLEEDEDQLSVYDYGGQIFTNNEIIDNNLDKKNFIWFVPNCSNIWGGGHYTSFRFINYFSVNHDVNNIIFIYDNVGKEESLIADLQKDLNKAFKTDKFILISEYEKLPQCQVAIATTWQSAYYVKKKAAKHKFYFMQDYESMFYPSGTMALQANYTYEFGFYGITGGDWLKSKYESYGSKAQAYIFSADRDIFYPSNPKGDVRENVSRIFFYGRPSTPRRAYELGIKALEMISENFPNIEIVIAGLSDIAPPKFKCTLLGNLSLKETGELYRTCDIGIALSATNMSYLPVELMASGCPVISNSGSQVEWYCQNDYNALLADPIPSAILEATRALVKSKDLRQKLVLNGLKTTAKTTWENEMEKIYQYINAKRTSS